MYKCKLCNKKFETLSGIYSHIENKHRDLIPKDLTVERYYYYLKTGKTNGNCVMCKNPTTWNEVTSKYNRFCSNPQCKEKYVAEFKKRMISKYGKVHLLNDPNKQREMLANRKISGKYRWTTREGEKTYTGSYELDFVKLMDVFFEWDPDDIMMPSPHTYTYDYEGEQKFYIPDVFIASLDLEIEIKDGGDNPNNHHKIRDVDKVKEKLKDDVMLSQKAFHYIKITNKNYTNFFNFLKEIKNHFEKYGEDKKAPKIFMIEDIKTKAKPEVVKESVAGDIIKTFNKHVLNKNVNDIESIIDKRVDSIKDTNSLNDFTDYLLKLTKTVESIDEYKTIEDTLNKVVDRIESIVKRNPEYRDELTKEVRKSIVKIQNENKKRRDTKIFKEHSLSEYLKGDGEELISETRGINIAEESIRFGDKIDRFLLVLDKPIDKILNRDVKLYHGSSVDIKDKQLTPQGINVGAVKYSDPRWSTFFWDNKESAIKWGSFRAACEEIPNCSVLFLGDPKDNRIVISSKEGLTKEEFIKKIKDIKPTFYVYEASIPASKISIGSHPSIKEYTVSENVDIEKKIKYVLDEKIFNHYFKFMEREDYLKLAPTVTVKNIKYDRGPLLNFILDAERDANRRVIRRLGAEVGSDLSKYRDVLNSAIKNDIYGLREASMEESVGTNTLSLYMVYDENKRPRQQFTLNDYESLIVVDGKYSLQRQPKTNLLKISSFDKNECRDQKILEYNISCDNIDVKKIENIITEGNIKLFGLFDKGRFGEMFLNEVCKALQISNPEISFVGELDGGVM